MRIVEQNANEDCNFRQFLQTLALLTINIGLEENLMTHGKKFAFNEIKKLYWKSLFHVRSKIFSPTTYNLEHNWLIETTT